MKKFKIECCYESSDSNEPDSNEPDFTEVVEAPDVHAAIEIVCDMSTDEHFEITRIYRFCDKTGEYEEMNMVDL